MGHTDYSSYFSYLLNKSRLGTWYRENYLYPRLSACLSGRVLDVGCGIGDFLEFRPNTVGVDINPFNIQYCKSRGLEAYRIEEGKYPFPDDSFDCANMDNVLEHLQTDQVGPVFREIFRVLKSHGLLLIGVPGEKGFQSDSDHRCFYDEMMLVKTMERFHCAPIRIFHMPFKSRWMEKHFRQYCVYGLFRVQ